MNLCIYSTAFVVRRSDPWPIHVLNSIKGNGIATGRAGLNSSMEYRYQHYLDDRKIDSFS